jgi:hypothetical protein
MWVHGCGLFRISTEPEFSEFITPDRGSAVRIRTGGHTAVNVRSVSGSRSPTSPPDE